MSEREVVLDAILNLLLFKKESIMQRKNRAVEGTSLSETIIACSIWLLNLKKNFIKLQKFCV